MKSETEEDAKNTGDGRVRLRARKSLTLRQFWPILRKKPTVLQSTLQTND